MKKDNGNEEKSFQELEKKLLVSILLSESTTSELQLDLPNLEDLKSTEDNEDIELKVSTYNLNDVFVNELMESISNMEFGKISSDTAYFSSKHDLYESNSSMEINEGNSVESLEEGPSGSNKKLKSVQVFTRPLVAVNSIAHQNCIENKHNNILVTIMDSRNSNSDWINVCRICHGGESIGNLLSPCQCRGSIASTHIQCLERWLKESATSHCELCGYHYTIIRQPKYSPLQSVFVYLQQPGDHLWEIICDTLGLIIYTSATVMSTYTLSLLCESVLKSPNNAKYVSSQLMGFTTVLGIAVIHFAYTSWLLNNLEKHTVSWQTWYRNSCDLKVVLSKHRQKIKYQSTTSLGSEQEVM
ncbi:hypothetical protein FQA39_LY13928 [Lamprigera yunnana]|nr:hypothetical protein FQA39_LY13928 [Lamprigera yunnana]